MDGADSPSISTDPVMQNIGSGNSEKGKVSDVELHRAGTKRCICHLPIELLLLILEHLSVFDFLSFRSVCRCWRIAFSRCPLSFFDTLQEQFPFVVFLNANSSSKGHVRDDPVLCPWRHLFYTTGKIGDPITQRVYNVPELNEKRFLLSRYGWLLLFSSAEGSSALSLFFYHPFSGSKICLPFLDVTRLQHPEFAVSTTPTSKDCTIFVVSCSKEKMEEGFIIINICRHGESAWSSWTFPLNDWSISCVVSVTFSGGVFHCLHNSGHLSTFDASNNCWIASCKLRLSRPHNRSYGPLLTYEMQHGSDMLWCIAGDGAIIVVKLQENIKIVEDRDVICSLYLMKRSFLQNFESMFGSLTNRMRFDSFGSDTWFNLCDLTEEGTRFTWRRLSWPIRCRHPLPATIAWLEVRWIQPSRSFSWIP